MIVLRDYQNESIEALRQGVREGHVRQVVCSPTGSGKSVIAAALIQEAVNKFSRTFFVADRIALVDQASALFDTYGLEHGIIQAGHWRWRPYERLQVCSAATLARRGISEDVKLLIVDEAHIQSRIISQFMLKHPKLICVGLSATPFTKGLGKIYSNVVNVRTTNQLIEEKWLVPLHQYVAKTVDMKGAKVKSTGEWEDLEMEKRGLAIVGDVVGEWIKRCDEVFSGPVKTIVFSSTVDHGAELCRQWQDSGHNFQQISYKDGNDEKRRSLIEEFRRPDSEITGLVSCEALSRGFDVTDIRFGVFCRPYRKSLSGWVQQLGRVMRPHEGKEFAVSHDHAGNTLRFREDADDFFANGVHDLDSGKHDSKVRKEPTAREKEAFVCSCGFVLPKGSVRCPACGKERARRLSMVEQVDGRMVEVGERPRATTPDYLCDKQAVWRQICYHALERKKGDALAAERFAKAAYKNIYGTWPAHAMRNIEPEPPHPKLLGKIRSNLIAWARRRAA